MKTVCDCCDEPIEVHSDDHDVYLCDECAEGLAMFDANERAVRRNESRHSQ